MNRSMRLTLFLATLVILATAVFMVGFAIGTQAPHATPRDCTTPLLCVHPAFSLSPLDSVRTGGICVQ